MNTLGINAAFHDSSACLVRDGAVVAAAEEERFTRIKHAKRPVPFSAWELPCIFALTSAVCPQCQFNIEQFRAQQAAARPGQSGFLDRLLGRRRPPP